MYQMTIFVHASVSRIYGIAKERKLRVGQVHENLCNNKFINFSNYTCCLNFGANL
jgi:hypothetical protein